MSPEPAVVVRGEAGLGLGLRRYQREHPLAVTVEPRPPRLVFRGWVAPRGEVRPVVPHAGCQRLLLRGERAPGTVTIQSGGGGQVEEVLQLRLVGGAVGEADRRQVPLRRVLVVEFVGERRDVLGGQLVRRSRFFPTASRGTCGAPI
jgi:hypothetical protein